MTRCSVTADSFRYYSSSKAFWNERLFPLTINSTIKRLTLIVFPQHEFWVTEGLAAASNIVSGGLLIVPIVIFILFAQEVLKPKLKSFYFRVMFRLSIIVSLPSSPGKDQTLSVRLTSQLNLYQLLKGVSGCLRQAPVSHGGTRSPPISGGTSVPNPW